MSLFDTLAETRYQRWLEEKAKPGYKAPPPVLKTASRKSFEAHLLSEIRALVKKARQTAHREKREDYLRQARRLEIQMLVSLERQGLYRVAAVMRGAVSRYLDANASD